MKKKNLVLTFIAFSFLKTNISIACLPPVIELSKGVFLSVNYIENLSDPNNETKLTKRELELLYLNNQDTKNFPNGSAYYVSDNRNQNKSYAIEVIDLKIHHSSNPNDIYEGIITSITYNIIQISTDDHGVRKKDKEIKLSLLQVLGSKDLDVGFKQNENDHNFLDTYSNGVSLKIDCSGLTK